MDTIHNTKKQYLDLPAPYSLYSHYKIRYQNCMFSFVLITQLLPDQVSLLNRTKAQICNPLKNLQSAYKSIVVSCVQNEVWDMAL